MKYRTNQKTGDRISEVGGGTAYIFEAGLDEGANIIRRAYEGGINYFDLAAGDGKAFPIFREALELKASDCIGCGHCDDRCPFHVTQSERMQEIREYMEG